MVATALERVCLAAEQAEPRSLELLVTIAFVLTEPQAAELAQMLREEAAGRALVALARLLRRPLGRESSRPEPKEGVVPDYGVGRPLTLGERRALARKPTRAALEKLLADPHPMVIRLLLTNPKVTEDDVVRLAARRLSRAEVLAEIARNSRWALRPRVRMTLILNPTSPVEITVPLVGLLTRAELGEVVRATDVGPVVRGAAHDRLGRRPPLKAPAVRSPVN